MIYFKRYFEFYVTESHILFIIYTLKLKKFRLSWQAYFWYCFVFRHKISVVDVINFFSVLS